MGSFVKDSFYSFKVNKDFWLQLLVEGLAFAFIIFMIIGFGELLEMKAFEISQGQSVDQLKSVLLAGSADYNQVFLSNVKGFALLLTLGIVAVFLASVFIYSYAQAHIWHSLMGKKFSWNVMKKWIGMTFIVLLLCAVFVLFYFLTQVVMLFFPLDEGSALVVDRIITFLFVYGFVFVIPFLYYFFAHTGLVWKGIGDFFSYVNKKKMVFIKGYIFAVFVGVLIALVSSVIRASFQASFRALTAGLPLIMMIILLLWYFSWLRNYVYTVLAKMN